MNFAENLLYSRIPGEATSKRGFIGKEDGKIALTEVREGYTEVRDVSWGQLRKEVGVLASAMKEHGVKKGDRVVVVASNSVDTLKVFLAVTTLGGLFSSSSTDMGVQGVLQRALQVTPKVRSTTFLHNKANVCAVHIHGRFCNLQWEESGSSKQNGRDISSNESGRRIRGDCFNASIFAARRH